MNVSPNIPLLAAAFSVGLVGSLHCIGMCGPFAALAGSRGVRGVAAYSVGRAFTYAGLGAFAGLFGAALMELRMVGLAVATGLVLIVALQLAGVLPEPKAGAKIATPLIRWVHKARAGRFALGLTTALLPCGLVYAGLGVAVSAAHPGVGALAMLMFAAGTVPASLVSAFGGAQIYRAPLAVRRVAAVCVAAAGMWALSHRAPAPSLSASETVPECCMGHVSAPQSLPPRPDDQAAHPRMETP